MTMAAAFALLAILSTAIAFTLSIPLGLWNALLAGLAAGFLSPFVIVLVQFVLQGSGEKSVQVETGFLGESPTVAQRRRRDAC
jgi:hypothetical protein